MKEEEMFTEEEWAPRVRTAVAKRCDCYHPFQDEEHGRGMRVHNRRSKDDKFACTVCSNVRE